jgi:hypothetical protein
VTGVCVEAAPAFAANAKRKSASRPWSLGFCVGRGCGRADRAPGRAFRALLDRCLDNGRCCGLLDAASIARANAECGLNLLPLCWLQRPPNTTSPLGAELALERVKVMARVPAFSFIDAGLAPSRQGHRAPELGDPWL